MASVFLREAMRATPRRKLNALQLAVLLVTAVAAVLCLGGVFDIAMATAQPGSCRADGHGVCRATPKPESPSVALVPIALVPVGIDQQPVEVVAVPTRPPSTRWVDPLAARSPPRGF